MSNVTPPVSNAPTSKPAPNAPLTLILTVKNSVQSVTTPAPPVKELGNVSLVKETSLSSWTIIKRSNAFLNVRKPTSEMDLNVPIVPPTVLNVLTPKPAAIAIMDSLPKMENVLLVLKDVPLVLNQTPAPPATKVFSNSEIPKTK